MSGTKWPLGQLRKALPTPMASDPGFAKLLFFTRGGILEAEGTVEIKFRKKELLKAMRRTDATYAQIVQQLGKRHSRWGISPSPLVVCYAHL